MELPKVSYGGPEKGTLNSDRTGYLIFGFVDEQESTKETEAALERGPFKSWLHEKEDFVWGVETLARIERMEQIPKAFSRGVVRAWCTTQ